MNTEQEVLKIIANITNHSIDELKKNKNSTDMWDSFTAVEIVFAIEEKFGISLSQDQLSKLNTVDSIISIVNK